MTWPFPSTNAQADARLIEAELDLLHRLAFRLARHAVDAEDLVQETCLRAWRARDQLRRVADPRAWLCRILRNAWFDQCRRRHRSLQLVETAEETESVIEETFPPVLLPGDDREKIEAAFDGEVLAALDALPEEERLVVIFYTFGEMNYRAISEAMECPIGTVMSRLHRGRAKLRAHLARYAQERGIVRRSENSPADPRSAEGGLGS